MAVNSDQGRLAELHDAIVALAQRVEAIDIREVESHSPAVLAGELAPVVIDVLRDAQHVVSEVLRTCERLSRNESTGIASEPPPPYVPFEHALDVAVDRTSSPSFEAIGDIGFLASLELRQRLERLERVREGNHWAIVYECDSALRGVRKAMMALDQGLARKHGAEPRLDYASEIEIAISVRRTYAKLRARVRSVGEPQGETFYVQLRSIGTALAVVVGGRGYPDLRIRDRMQLRELQRRLIDWFRSDRGMVSGHRLWQDLNGFVEMLAGVTRRQELKEHDVRVVDAALAVVDVEGTGSIPPETLASLEALHGLDDEVDALLRARGPERGDARAWRAPLARLKQELSHPRGMS